MIPGISRRLRRHFGIAVRPAAVSTRWAWYWRLLGATAVGAMSVALGLSLYDAGRRFAGLDRDVYESEITELRAKVAQLSRESALLQALADASDASLKIERAAQSQLAEQIKTLEQQNLGLKEDLAFFENLVPSAGRDERLTINGFRIAADAIPGEYRYRLLLLQGGTQAQRDFDGTVQLVVDIEQDGRTSVLTLPADKPGENQELRVHFKRFQRVEGSFRVNPDAKVRSVQVRVLENGGREPRAIERFRVS